MASTLLVFDFDSTLIAEESLVSLLSKSPHQKEIQSITEQGIKGQISMLHSYQQRLAYLDPQIINVDEYLHNFHQLTPGMPELIRDLSQNKHCSIVVLSQGPHCIVEPICAKFFPSISHIHSVEVDLSTKQIFSTDFLSQGKAWYLNQKQNLSQFKQIIIIGDGVSDMKIKSQLQPQYPFITFISIGFGLILHFEQTKSLADYFVTQSVETELRPLLMQLLINPLHSMQQRMSVCNFTPGPSQLPNTVMQQVAMEGCWNYQETGMAFAELSHRSKEFEQTLQECKRLLYELLECSAEVFEILFMQGGGHGQFSAIPMNCLRKWSNSSSLEVNYIVNGEWSKKAYEECNQFASHFSHIKVHSINSSHKEPSTDTNPVYTYYCDNETIHGIEMPNIPPCKQGYLICDMSSNFLTRPIEMSKFGIIFACAQKNFGISGLTLVLIKKELLHVHQTHPSLTFIPTVLDYSVMSKYDSLYNTPPTLNIFLLAKLLQWMKRMGGLHVLDQLAQQRSGAVYAMMDDSFYCCPVQDRAMRSRMNVVCRIKNGKREVDTQLEELFVKEAEKRNIVGVKGHRLVGGLRFSLYNACTMEQVNTLVQFMKEFKQQHNSQM